MEALETYTEEGGGRCLAVDLGLVCHGAGRGDG
jgi:hypothetical protein